MLEGERGAGQTCVATVPYVWPLDVYCSFFLLPPCTHTHTAGDDSCKGGKAGSTRHIQTGVARMHPVECDVSTGLCYAYHKGGGRRGVARRVLVGGSPGYSVVRVHASAKKD